MVVLGLERLMGSLKSKVNSFKVKKPYDKMEKTDSIRVEIRSCKAQKLIEETLKVADSPKTKNILLKANINCPACMEYTTVIGSYW